MPTYDGIGSSITHEIEVVGDVFISNVEGGSLSTQVPFEIFSNVYGMATPPTDSRQVRLRVQPTTQASPDDSYVSDMGIQNTTDNYFFITAPQNTSSVGDQNTFVISKTSNVGIGTNNPEKPLHVVGDSWVTGTLTTSNIVANSGENLSLNSNLFVDTATGRVGIGTDSPSYKLHVKEDVDGIAQIRIENQDPGTTARARFSMQNLSNVASIDLVKNNIFNIENNAETESLAQLRLIQKGDRPITFCTNGSGNERMRIAGDGNVGIGVASPGAKLHVDSTNPQIIIGSGTGGGEIEFGNSSHGVGRNTGQTNFTNANDVVLYTAGSGGAGLKTANGFLKVASNGNVGIGVASPSYNLHVVGNIYATGDITAFSDKRYKDDLLVIESALGKVKQLTGYTYTLHGNRSAGLLAQDVLEVLPEVVKGSEETNYSLAYGNLMGLIVEAIKELDKKVDRILEKQ